MHEPDEALLTRLQAGDASAFEAVGRTYQRDLYRLAYRFTRNVEDAKDRREIGLELHSGQNRIVRRIFEALGYKVTKLDRVVYAGLTKKGVARGKWRFLDEQEVIRLKMLK